MVLDFVSYFVWHRIAPFVLCIFGFYFIIEMHTVAWLAILTHFFESTYNMNTGCPLGNFSCTGIKQLPFYHDMGIFELYLSSFGLFLLELAIIFVTLAPLFMLCRCLLWDYRNFEKSKIVG